MEIVSFRAFRGGNGLVSNGFNGLDCLVGWLWIGGSGLRRLMVWIGLGLLEKQVGLVWFGLVLKISVLQWAQPVVDRGGENWFFISRSLVPLLTVRFIDREVRETVTEN